jgi:ribosomal 50S subunit-recycling heat shock protein
MRVDNFISDSGIVKRRTVAKELAEGGHVSINGRRAKPAHDVKVGDIIEITGKNQIVIRVRKLIEGRSVPKDARSEYFEVLSKSSGADFDL